ncbi:MAG: rhomboid family intramembrane serine protease [Hyphomicrobiaceae bacterium]
MIPTSNTIPYDSPPRATWAIMGMCLAMFAWQASLSQAEAIAFAREFALVPARYTSPAFAEKYGLTFFGPLPWLTSMFMHGGILHIAGNLWVLWVFGPALEDRLGSARYLVLYLASGLAAGLLHVLFNVGSTVPTLGASGAIAGVIAAYARRFPYAWVNVLAPVGFVPFVFAMPALMFGGFWFVLQVTQAAGSLVAGPGGGIAWWAHVGGFAAGWLLVKRMAPPADQAEEVRAATESWLWPWRAWWRWVGWWWGRR